MLQKRLAGFEAASEKMTEENKKLQVLGRRRGSGSDLEKMDQMQKDIDRFVARIAELETKNKELSDKNAKLAPPSLPAAQQSNSADNIADMAKENSAFMSCICFCSSLTRPARYNA